MTSIERELGNFQARMETVENELLGLREDLRELRDAFVSARGGYRFMMAAIVLASSLGAVLGHYLPLLAGLKS